MFTFLTKSALISFGTIFPSAVTYRHKEGTKHSETVCPFIQSRSIDRMRNSKLSVLFFLACEKKKSLETYGYFDQR